jgi:hypothetical protein
MLGEMKQYFSEKYDSTLSDFSSYLAMLLEKWDISQEEYQAIQISLQNEDFKKFLVTFTSVEAIHVLNWYIKHTITLFLSLQNPQNTLFYIVSIFTLDRFLRIFYSCLIARHYKLSSPFVFWVVNSIPFGKLVTPVMWLKKDKELVKYFSQQQREKIELILSNPLFQGMMRII